MPTPTGASAPSARRDSEQLARAIGWADLLITTASPPPDCGALRPDAAHLSITPHGLATELSNARGGNLTASARSGWAYINANAEEPPLALPSRQAGYVGGLAGFLAAAAALLRPRRA